MQVKGPGLKANDHAASHTKIQMNGSTDRRRLTLENSSLVRYTTILSHKFVFPNIHHHGVLEQRI